MLKLATTLVLLAACSVGAVEGGGTPTPDGGGNDPRAGTFATVVTPIVTGKTCTDTGCHSGSALPNLTSFEMMTSNAANATKYLKQPAAENILITKDNVAGTPGMHSQRPYLSADDKTAISNWIDSGP